MGEDTNEDRDDDEACRRAWEGRLDVGPIIKRELKPKKRVTGFQSRMICAYANIHHRTLERWREGRSRTAESERIKQACIELGWSNLLDEPFEDPDNASGLGE